MEFGTPWDSATRSERERRVRDAPGPMGDVETLDPRRPISVCCQPQGRFSHPRVPDPGDRGAWPTSRPPGSPDPRLLRSASRKTAPLHILRPEGYHGLPHTRQETRPRAWCSTSVIPQGPVATPLPSVVPALGGGRKKSAKRPACKDPMFLASAHLPTGNPGEEAGTRVIARSSGGNDVASRRTGLALIEWPGSFGADRRRAMGHARRILEGGTGFHTQLAGACPGHDIPPLQ